MDKRLSFPSIQFADSIGYALHESWYNVRFEARSGSLGDCYGAFKTYGDGSTQHGPEYAAPVELFTDYLGSLAAHLLANPADVAIVASRWREPLAVESIRFYAGLKYVEGKKQYYSTETHAVSTSKAKANDRRWEEVPMYADGSLEAIFRLMSHCVSGTSAVLRYGLLAQVADVVNEPSYRFYRLDCLKLAGIGTNDDDANYWFNNAHDAYVVVDLLVRAYRLAECARRQFVCFENNWIRNVCGQESAQVQI